MAAADSCEVCDANARTGRRLAQLRADAESVLDTLYARRGRLRWDAPTAQRHAVEAECLDSLCEALEARVYALAGQQRALRPYS